MEIGSIIARLRKSQKNMTSRNATQIKYKCNKCHDTGWIQTKNGCVRCDCFKKEYSEKLWKKFGVDPDKVKKLNDYKAYDSITKQAKEKAVQYITSFQDIRHSKENSFGLFGQPGAGKSHIIIAMGAALLQKNIQVVYMPYVEVTRRLKAATFDNEYFIKSSEKFIKAETLIIDDLFKDKVKNGELLKDRYGNILGLTKSEMDCIYPILNYRYLNELPTLFSTECTPDMLLDLDEALAGRILEPCGKNITVFNTGQNDYRLKKFEKK